MNNLLTSKNTIIGLSILAGISVQCSNPEKEEEKPNVLFLIFDDLRPELGCYGFPVHSPNLDRIAESGMRFTNAYCNIPVCGASRASLLTGTRPTKNTFLNYDSYAEKDKPEAVTLPEYFQQNGYYTIARNKVFGMPDDSDDSWDELWSPIDTTFYWRDYANPENIYLDSIGGFRKGSYPYEFAAVPDSAYFDGKSTEMAIRDLRKLKEKDQPFFLAVGFRKPHLPYNAPKKYWDLYEREQFQLPENYIVPEETNIPRRAFHNWGELRAYYGVPSSGPLSDSMAITLQHGYYACISYVDQLAGRILEELETLGLDDNTIVVVAGDHGYNLGEHGLWCKHCNFNTSLKSLLMLKVPEYPGGQKTSSITEFVDIFPTLTDLCNLPDPAQLEGKSFKKVLENPSEKNDEIAVARWENGITLIYNDLFYTEWRDEKDSVATRMLFDHSTDPQENNNLAVDKEYQNLMDSLSNLLVENRGNWLERD